MLNNIATLYGSGAAAVTGNYYSISSAVVDAAGASSITFSSIPSTYTHLQIRASVLSNGTYSANDIMQFNSDTGSNYSYHALYGNGTSAASNGNATKTSIATSITPSSTYPMAVVIDILDYANTSKYKTVRILAGNDVNSTNGYIFFDSGLWQSTSAINSISWAVTAGSWTQYSTVSLYGVK